MYKIVGWLLFHGYFFSQWWLGVQFPLVFHDYAFFFFLLPVKKSAWGHCMVYKVSWYAFFFFFNILAGLQEDWVFWF